MRAHSPIPAAVPGEGWSWPAGTFDSYSNGSVGALAHAYSLLPDDLRSNKKGRQRAILSGGGVAADELRRLQNSSKDAAAAPTPKLHPAPTKVHTQPTKKVQPPPTKKVKPPPAKKVKVERSLPWHGSLAAFQNMSDDIFVLISLQCSLEDLLLMSRVCKAFRKALEHNAAWVEGRRRRGLPEPASLKGWKIPSERAYAALVVGRHCFVSPLSLAMGQEADPATIFLQDCGRNGRYVANLTLAKHLCFDCFGKTTESIIRLQRPTGSTPFHPTTASLFSVVRYPGATLESTSWKDVSCQVSSTPRR